MQSAKGKEGKEGKAHHLKEAKAGTRRERSGSLMRLRGA
jgi:hypothetical protein